MENLVAMAAFHKKSNDIASETSHYQSNFIFSIYMTVELKMTFIIYRCDGHLDFKMAVTSMYGKSIQMSSV